MTTTTTLPPSEFSFDAHRDWREANDVYRAALHRIAERLAQAERDAWHIADDEQRRTVVTAAYETALAATTRLRSRYETETAAKLRQLTRRAFVPWAGETADRSAHDALVEELDRRISTQDDAYRELHTAERDRATNPHGPLAVYTIAHRRGWRDVVALGRNEGKIPGAKYGHGPIGALLDFETDTLDPATFTIPQPLAAHP